MSAGPQLDGDGGGTDDVDTGGSELDGRDARVRDAVGEFQREQLRADVRRVQVSDMEPDRDSRDDTTARPASGDTGDEPQSTADRTSQEDTTAEPTTGTPGGQTAPDDDAGTEPSPADEFGQELGGDPAGEIERDSRDDTTARPAGGEEPGMDGPDPADVRDPVGRGRPEQGIEQGGATGELEARARQFEQRILEANPTLSEEDVRIQFVGTEEGPELRAEFTEGAGGRVRGRVANFLSGLGFEGAGTEEVRAPDAPGQETMAEQEADAEVQEALEGVGFFEERAEQRQERIEAFEQQLEQAIGQQRAAAFGATDPAQTRQIIERTDLEFGEDFTVEAGEPEERTFTDPETGETVTRTVTPLEASLTGEFEEEFLADLAGFRLAQQFGAEFEPGEDFLLNDEGEVELTDEGAAKAQTQNIRQFVADLESRVFDVPVVGEFQVDVPGEGPIIETAERQDLGTSAEAIRVRAGPEDEFMTLQEAISSGSEAIFEATEVSEEAPIEAMEARRGRAGAATRQEAAEFTGAGRQPVAQASSGVLRTPAFLLEGANLGIDAAEFGGELAGAADLQVGPSGVGVTFDEERFNELTTALETATAQRLAQTADVVAEDPGEFAARGVGSIIGTGGLFAGARLLGRVPSVATRGLIQPGEEIAGIGGNRLTRMLASERRAQQLFPQNEPLIFSEEAAIRRGAQVGRRARDVGVGAQRRLAREGVAARFRLAEAVSPETPNRPLGVGERLARARTSARFRAAEFDPRTDVANPASRLIRRGVDDAQDIIDRIEIEDSRIGAGLGGVPEVRLRPRAEARSEAEARTELDQEAATRPEVDADSEAETVGRMRRAETAVEAGELLDEAEAMEVAEAASARRERAEIDVPEADLTRPAIDIDARAELRTEAETLAEVRGETGTEGGLETRTETDVEQQPFEEELQQEVEAEAEQRAETEVRQREREAEAEAEAEIFDEQALEDEEDFLEELIGDEEFESGIADIEDFEEGLLGGGDMADIERDIIDG